MSASGEQDLSNFSMLDLFRQEADSQTALLVEGLLALEKDPGQPDRLQGLMRAAHSIKGAARIVGLEVGVQVAHALEDVFVAAQKGEIVIQPESADALLKGVDLLQRVAKGTAIVKSEVDALLSSFKGIRAGGAGPSWQASEPLPPEPLASPASPQSATAAPGQGVPAPQPAKSSPRESDSATERTVRLSSDRLGRMLGMMGELTVHTRWFEPFREHLLGLKERQKELVRLVEAMREAPQSAQKLGLTQLQRQLEENVLLTAARHEQFESFAHGAADLAERLYRDGLSSRMRPFADGVRGFPRLVRDLARQLGKDVRLEIVGEKTWVDREILEKLEAPLTHLVRNSLDHGLELPQEREAAGKPPQGVLTVQARHQAGLLHVTVGDDGRGIRLEKIRRKIVERGLVAEERAATLTSSEVLEFLFMPGFSTSEQVTEISGRGVGLDVVRMLTQELGGRVRVENRPGDGTSFHLELPITLSIMRAALVEIAGEPYAIPLSRIQRLLTASPDEIRNRDDQRYIVLEDCCPALVDARELLKLEGGSTPPAELPLVMLGDPLVVYTMVVDRFLGESQLAVRPLDSRLGKLQHISAAASMEDGTPVLILDCDDLVNGMEMHRSRSWQKFFAPPVQDEREQPSRKRILVVDDSVTVRETERKVLEDRGFLVEAASDGMDGWNKLLSSRFDLVVTDIDMPHMDGLELVRRIREDPRLSKIPVVVVSSRDREEDRSRGKQSGANEYLTKGSIRDISFLKAITNLIGEPRRVLTSSPTP